MDYSQVVLFSDLDGTLFDDNKNVSRKNRKALDYFTAHGGLFGISTGRSPSNASAMLGGVPINSWSVVLDGAEAYHFKTGTVAFPRTLTRIRMAVFLQEVLDLLPEVDVLVCTESRQFLISDPERADEYFCSLHKPVAFASLGDVLTFPWLKVMFRGTGGILSTLEAGAAKRGIFEICRRIYTAGEYLEFVPVTANKGRCLESLRTMDCFGGRKFAAVGDWTNDLELLSEADIPIAVGNALPEVKDRAKIITRSNNEDAIAQLIYDILPAL